MLSWANCFSLKKKLACFIKADNKETVENHKGDSVWSIS